MYTIKRRKSNRVSHIGLENKKLQISNIQSSFFTWCSQSLDGISKSVLKGVFLVKKRGL